MVRVNTACDRLLSRFMEVEATLRFSQPVVNTWREKRKSTKYRYALEKNLCCMCVRGEGVCGGRVWGGLCGKEYLI